MAGTFTRRCENPICKRIVMVADRGRVGDAFGSTVETDELGVPHATCPACQTVTAWPPKATETLPRVTATPLSGARLVRLAECIAEGSHAAIVAPATSSGMRAVTMQQTCLRCGTVFASEGFI